MKNIMPLGGLSLYYCCGICDMGTVRDNNEDAFLLGKTVVSEPGRFECTLDAPFFAAVADGVAGKLSGEVASRLALKSLAQTRITPELDLNARLLAVHKKLRSYGKSHKNAENMQTTLCLLTITDENGLMIANVGDSRMYSYINGEVRQLTRDQSLVQLLYEAGRISHEERHGHAQKNIILPAMGNTVTLPKPEISLKPEGIPLGGTIIICSDGLSDYLTAAEIEEQLAEPMKLLKRLKKLVESAKAKGSPDNITVAAVSRVADERG